MGVYGHDIIGGDSTLEFAMDLLTRAGIGPKDYDERKKTISICISDCRGDGVQFLGRHTAHEYAEFFECLAAAAHKGFEIKKRLGPMLALCNATGFIRENSLDKGDDDGGVVSMSIHIMILILMQAGCLLEPMRLDVISGRMTDFWERPSKQRGIHAGAQTRGLDLVLAAHQSRARAPVWTAAHWRHFVEAVKKYVPPKYDHVSAEIGITSGGGVKLLLCPMLRGTAVTYRPLSLFDARPLQEVDDSDVIAANLAEVTTREIVLRANMTYSVKRATTPEEMQRVKVEGDIERSRNPAMYHGTCKSKADPKKLVGQRVEVSGLVGRSDLNGSVGDACAYDSATGR